MGLSLDLPLQIVILDDEFFVLKSNIFEFQDFHVLFAELFGDCLKLIDGVDEFADLLFESEVVLGKLLNFFCEFFGLLLGFF